MKPNKNLGVLCLAAWLVLTGLVTIIDLSFSGLGTIMAVLAIAAGKDNYDVEANQTMAKNLKGRLLLAHGMLDDNVPPYNTLLVVEELIKANKDFDLIVFPSQRHGYGSQAYYMMRRR